MEDNSNNQQKEPRKGGRIRKRNYKRSRGKKIVPEKEFDPIICSICEKPIESITQAFSGDSPGDIAHFDCVLKKLQEDEKLTERQRISYIGNGTFAVIEYKNKNTTGPFTIIKRFQIETKETMDKIKKIVNERKNAVDLTRKRR